MNKNKPNYGKITTPAEIGQMIRAKRQQEGLTQAEVAGLCNVGNRFLSELENGKTTTELGKVLKVLNCLGLNIIIAPRSGFNL